MREQGGTENTTLAFFSRKFACFNLDVFVMISQQSHYSNEIYYVHVSM
jgi:hypothetical protein